jgi:large subunit ribosomal protein L4
MVSLPVYNRNGEEVGAYEIDPAELAPRISKQLLHDVVVMYQANQRPGVDQDEEPRRGRRIDQEDVSPEGHRQCTGRPTAERCPPRRRAHFRPASTRDYSYRLPKKAIRLATRMAMASKIEDNQVVVIDQLAFDEPKTRQMAAILKALRVEGSLLVAVEAHDPNLFRSVRNIANVSVLPVADLNALEVLRPKRMLMTKAALDAFRGKVKQQTQAS